VFLGKTVDGSSRKKYQLPCINLERGKKQGNNEKKIWMVSRGTLGKKGAGIKHPD